MSRKWLEREAKKWVEQQIITDQQYEQIVELYPPHPRRTQMLPALASILLGFSLLTFVASNWDGMSYLLRLLFLMTTMTAFYAFGYSFYRKGQQWVGQGLLALGVVTFGASMILIGQMYHLIAYDARLFVFWSLAALGAYYLVRRALFFYMAGALILAGQVYNLLAFSQLSYGLIIVTAAILGIFAYQSNRSDYGMIVSCLLGLQSVFLIIDQSLPWLWMSVVPFALYAIGVGLGDRAMARGFQVGPKLFGFVFAAFMVFAHDLDDLYDEALPDPLAFAAIYASLLAFSYWKMKTDWKKWAPMLLFLPFFYFAYGGFFYLFVMFVFASLYIYIGDEDRQPWKANLGVSLFLASSVIGYFQLAWDFLDKSLFFLFGGLLLLSVHWILRRRHRWLAKERK